MSRKTKTYQIDGYTIKRSSRMEKGKEVDIRWDGQLDELFESVRLLIWKICHRHAVKYGGDVEDHYEHAGLLFMRALKAYKPSKGSKFSSLLYQHVQGGLLDAFRFQKQRESKLKPHGEAPLPFIPDDSTFDVRTLKRSVSRDGALVIHLTITYPGKVGPLVRGAGLHQGAATVDADTQQDIQGELRWWLMEWGWNPQRISSAFQEVASALSA